MLLSHFPPFTADSAWVEDEYTPTSGQVTFVLSQAPVDANSLVFMVNGVISDDVTDYAVSGLNVTWLDNLFVMGTTDKVLIRYK